MGRLKLTDMEINHSNDNSIAGTLITILIGAITFADVEFGLKVLAALSATAASITTIYWTIRNNRKK